MSWKNQIEIMYKKIYYDIGIKRNGLIKLISKAISPD